MILSSELFFTGINLQADYSRVLKWVFERCEGTAKATETPIGFVPAPDALDVSGLDVSDEDLAQLLSVDVDGWLEEIPKLRDHYAKFGDHLPQELADELDALEERLKAAR